MANRFLRSCTFVFLLVVLASPITFGQTQSGSASVSSSVQVAIPASVSQNGFTGSVPAGNPTPEVLPISFLDAIDRGLKQNLGLLLSSDNTIAARGEKWKELSNLLPNVSAKGQENVQQTSLIALGFRLPGLPPHERRRFAACWLGGPLARKLRS